MHGCSSASDLVVNAEVDSMGGVVEGGVGVGTKTSPRRAAIEMVQAELRQEYDVREERRRELEFLEKGGNPLDFNFGKATSVSVQSTSLIDQHLEPFLTSEAKGSFAVTASPRGDSVESSGRPGAHSASEPNSADNLMLFDGENDFIEGDRSSAHPGRTNVAPTEHSFQLEESQNSKELGDSAAFGLPKKAYKRRSRPNRDGARSSSTDAVLARGCYGSSLPSCHSPREAKGLVSDEENQKEQKVSSNSDSKPTSPNSVKVCKTVPSEGQLDMELGRFKAVESTANSIKSDPQPAMVGGNASKDVQDDQHNPESVVDAHKSHMEVALEETESFKGREEVVPLGIEGPHVPVIQVENQASSGQTNGFITAKGDKKRVPNEGKNHSAVVGTKVLDSESSCTQTSLSLDGNNDSDMCTNIKIDNTGNVKEETSVIEGKPTLEGDQMIDGKKETKADDSFAFTNDECNSAQRNNKENGFIGKTQEEINESISGFGKSQNQNELRDQIVESMEVDGCNVSGTESRATIPSIDNSHPQNENVCPVRHQGSTDCSTLKLPEAVSPAMIPTVAPDGHTSSDINFKANKADEDSILEEARIIETKRKRISELSMATLPKKNRRRSHWNFVLEEMTWLANDFAQERIWKITAAAQICQQVASTSRLRFYEQNTCWEHNKVAHILARAVMEFWYSLEEKREVQELQCSKKNSSLAIREYALRFLKCNSSDVLHNQAEAPMTPDRISDLGITANSLEDNLTEENLFYTVLPGAIETYRRSIVSHVVKYEKTGSSIQEEVETSAYDAVADFGSQDNAYEEDEGETSMYDTSVAFEGSKSSRFAQKKWKKSVKAYNSRAFEVVADSPYIHCTENKAGNQQPVLIGKRSAGSLNVSFPTKRVRTSNRQRVLSPFSAGTSGCVLMPTKTDASSGDTNSFQDDQSTLHGGSRLPNNLEVESVGDFEKQLPYDSTEISTKNIKKKAKHLGSTYEQRWQFDSNFQNELRDHPKKRSECHQLESNGLFGQYIGKKPKMMRQSLDNSFNSGAPVGGSAPSPMASQVSNQNKIMRMFGSRDGGRKNKALKMPATQSGSESSWSPFEEQALVVLVHDLGPNWELVSDAINSTLQFKCIFRNPKECKERHKMLMDRTGDGADSAEDSGSSQPYNSTLPGIPKGSARQLFQRLQGPMEEGTLRCHFDKIITIGQKLHYRRKQTDIQDPQQLQPPHSSHMRALSKYCPNYLIGGPVPTPLDFCDAPTPSSEILPLGYQSPHTGGLAISNQGAMAEMLDASANSPVSGSSNMIIGNSFSSSLGQISAYVRDANYAVPQSTSLSPDEQQRMQQYNQMLPGRNLQPSNLSSPGSLPGNDRGVRMLPGGSTMGITGGINRGLPIARPGFQGIPSSSVLNSGSIISSGMVAMPSHANMHTGAGSGQGNSTRPHDALHMMQPSQNQDSQRQILVPELQMQVSQGINQGIASFGALSSSFPNQTASPPVSSYPLHHQQSNGMSPQQPHFLSPHHPHLQGNNHAGSPQHQAYALRLAKERQLQQQQRMLQQQQQFASSNSMMPHVQTQTQLPISPPPQNSSQIKSQTSSPPVSLSPLTTACSMTSLPQHQQKHQGIPHGIGRNAQAATSGLTNQIVKQRHRQPQQQFQQAGRHHPQQRQQTQSQQQTKVLKVGRGNVMMHQNIPIDPSLLNGLSTNPANQTFEKGEQAMHILQGQGLYSGSAINPVQSGKPLVHSSNQSQPRQKMYSGQTSPLTKHLQQIPCHSDNVSQDHVSPVSSGPLSTDHHSVPPLGMASSNHQPSQVQPSQKLANQNQPSVQSVLQVNRHANSDPSTKLQGRKSQTDQNSTFSSSHMGVTATMPQTSTDAINAMQALSPASAPQWRASEPLYDSGTSSTGTNLSSIGTPPTNSAGNEPSSQVGQQGVPHKQSSGNLPPVGQDVGTQWQQQPSKVEQPPSPVSQQQQPASQKQLPSLQYSQQQTAWGK